MTKQQIVNQLRKNIEALKKPYGMMLSTTLKEGAEQYGSPAKFRESRNTIKIQIQTYNEILEWIEDSEYSYKDLINKNWRRD